MLTSVPTVQINGAPAQAALAPAPVAEDEPWYFCPMCPEVRQSGPGACPKCGMALEPDDSAPGSPRPNTSVPCTRRWSATARGVPELRHGFGAENRDRRATENPELREMSRRF